MSLTLNILVVITMVALVIILGAGLWSMFKGGGKLSQNLMRARVIVQFVAVLLLIALAFVMANGG
ncbi:MAG: twin transmembrane helix small protein [Devosiaceae bacterium]|nr:twin transmembrane helix small protein [Devosiaceae bacterium]